LNNAMESDDSVNEVIMNIERNTDDDFYGYDVYNKSYGNMKDAGVIDPTRVTRVSAESAVSIASLVLTTECAIVNTKRTTLVKNI
jgi:chaperonin GroEL